MSTVNVTSSSSSGSLSPTITSLGVGSGLDLNTIVTQLVALEQQPITQLQAKANVLNTEISDFGQIASLTSTLQDAATALRSVTLWSQQVATSTNSAAVGVTTGSGVLAGNYAITVQSLANAQTLSSNTTYSSANSLVGSGTLSLQLGGWQTDGSFSPQSGSSAVNISVSATDTLQTLATKVNSLGAGVTASVVTDASGSRLAFSSADTGATNGFRIQATDDDGNNTDNAGLSALAYDPANGANGMHLSQAASNSAAIINGISVSSASNTVTGAVSGLTLTLSQVTSTPVNVTVAPDKGALTTALQTFVTAFNGLASYLSTATAYDASTQVAGDLQGNSAANSLQSMLRTTLTTPTGASSVFKTLTDVGIKFQQDGTIAIDQPTLNTALNNLPELKKAFTTINNTTPANNGFGANFVNLTLNAVSAGGLVTTATSSLKTELSSNADAQTALNTRVASYQKTLMAQYTALDTQLAQLNALSSYVSQQLASLSGSNSKTG